MRSGDEAVINLVVWESFFSNYLLFALYSILSSLDPRRLVDLPLAKRSEILAESNSRTELGEEIISETIFLSSSLRCSPADCLMNARQYIGNILSGIKRRREVQK